MATLTTNRYHDSSDVTNFKAWAKDISDAFTSFGWTRSGDTGQVDWGTIASVPGSGAYVYEIWQPGDGLTTFYVKIQYGNQGGANNPAIKLSVGTTTDGSGTLTGLTFGPVLQPSTAIGSQGTVNQFNCYFSGDAGRIAVMMWRNGTGSCPLFFAIERSLDSSGAYTSEYVTLWTCGYQTSGRNASQRSIVLGVGVGPDSPNNTSNAGGFICHLHNAGSGASTAFNSGIPMDLCHPSVGKFGQDCTVVGAGNLNDFAEAVPFSVTIRGSSVTYLPSKVSPFTCLNTMFSAASYFALLMRYD